MKEKNKRNTEEGNKGKAYGGTKRNKGNNIFRKKNTIRVSSNS